MQMHRIWSNWWTVWKSRSMNWHKVKFDHLRTVLKGNYSSIPEVYEHTMGFKRAILNRLGITDKKVLLSAMDGNNENGHDDANRKHTDFSIAKILSEDTPRILHPDRFYHLNEFVWNNRLVAASPAPGSATTSAAAAAAYSNRLSAFVPAAINTKYEIMNFSLCMYDPRTHFGAFNAQLNPNHWPMPKPSAYDDCGSGSGGASVESLNSIYQSVNSYGLNLSLSDNKSVLVKPYATMPIDRIKEEPTAPNSSSTCMVCQKVFENALALETHERSHKSPRYKCEECGKGFSQLRNYKYHVSVHKGTKEFAAKCPECDKLFNDKGYLSSHLKIHRNKKEYSCPHCPKSFNQRVAFNMHVRMYVFWLDYYCINLSLCGAHSIIQIFSCLYRHSGIKPHKCFECGKCFSRKMLLKQHLRTHR